MKNAVLLIFLGISTISLAQDKTKDVGEFDEIKVYDLIEVNLIKSSENKVVVSGKNTDYVKIINDNGVLKIRMELEERFDGNSTTVDAYYTRLDIIDANEGAEISSKETITQNSLILRTQEGGIIEATLEVENLDVKSVSGGSVRLQGTATNQKIKINTGGGFLGRDFRTETTTVSITAAGTANVNASDKVTAKVTAGGSIYIYGNPKQVKDKKFAGGKIEIMN
jgi:hypothetical protein